MMTREKKKAMTWKIQERYYRNHTDFFFGGWGKYEMNKTQLYKTKYWRIIIWRHCSLDGCRNSCHGHGDCNVDQDGEYSCQCRFFIIVSSNHHVTRIVLHDHILMTSMVGAGIIALLNTNLNFQPHHPPTVPLANDWPFHMVSKAIVIEGRLNMNTQYSIPHTEYPVTHTNIPCQSFARILSCNVEFQGLVASLMLDKLL